jgi:hypothetical protein
MDHPNAATAADTAIEIPPLTALAAAAHFSPTFGSVSSPLNGSVVGSPLDSTASLPIATAGEMIFTPLSPSSRGPVRRSSRRAAALVAQAAAAKRSRSPSTQATPSPRKRARTQRSSGSSSKKKPPPNAKNDADYDEDNKPSAAVPSDVACCICMCEPEAHELSMINGCDHRFCFQCIDQWSDRENSCPLCKVRFTKITRLHPIKGKKGGPPNSKSVKDRDQRSDFLPGNALEGLLASITARNYNGTRMRSFIVSRSGGLFLPHFGSAFPRSSSTRLTFSIDDNLFGGRGDSDEDDDDDDDGEDDEFNPFSLFLRSRLGRMPPFGAGLGVTSGNHTNTNSNAHPAARSYASNASDATAGRNVSNPLEINDDDDDDDDVEVVQVTRRSG